MSKFTGWPDFYQTVAFDYIAELSRKMKVCRKEQFLLLMIIMK